MAIGDKIKVSGVEYEVVWCGGEGLTTITNTKSSGSFEPPKRLYNKTGKYAKKKQEEVKLAFNELFED